MEINNYIKGIFLSISLSLSMPVVSHAQLQSTVVAGSPDGTARKILLTDSTGRLLIVGSGVSGSVYGTDAVNAAPTQAPVLGACYGSSTAPTVVTTGRVQYNWCDLNGRLIISGNGTAGVAVTAGTIVGVQGGSSVATQLAVAIGGQLTTGVTNGGLGLMVGGYDGTNYRHLRQDTSGNLTSVGNVAAGASDSGNPVKVGAIYNSTLPTLTNGLRGDLQVGTRGSLNTSIMDPNGTNGAAVTQPGDGGATPLGLAVFNFNMGFNNSTYDRLRTVQGADAASGNGLGVLATGFIPSSNQQQSITPIVSSSLESNHVLKSGAGNLYRVRITTTLSGYLMLFNATSAPVDGAVTPQSCTTVGIGTTEIDHSLVPDRYTTGITAVFSTTGCLTKTASATAFFEGSRQ